MEVQQEVERFFAALNSAHERSRYPIRCCAANFGPFTELADARENPP